MKLGASAFLADQNIHADVVRFLRDAGVDVVDVWQAGLAGADDAAILAWAVSHGRVIVSHDADFGMLAIRSGTAYLGVVYLRPGHVAVEVTLDGVRQLLALDFDVRPPFMVIAKRVGDRVAIRVRTPGDGDS